VVKIDRLHREIIPDMTQVVKPPIPILDNASTVWYTADTTRGRKFNFRLKK